MRNTECNKQSNQAHIKRVISNARLVQILQLLLEVSIIAFLKASSLSLRASSSCFLHSSTFALFFSILVVR